MATRAAVTDARAAAAEICADLRSGDLLDSSFDRRTAQLEPRDRRWTRELVYGMLRRRSWLDAILAAHPHGLISGSGEDVGLPDGQMGNSEVGHMSLGSGRVLYQDFTRITKDIRDGAFFTHPVLTQAVDDAIAKKLSEAGIQVTRRTVAKYREVLRIPSTHQRRVKA